MAKFVLSEADKALLERLAQESKNRPIRGSGGGDPEPVVGTAPEVYIAITPVDGIPAIDAFVPGSAECDVYRILLNEVGTADPPETEPGLELVDGVTRTVYNLTESAIIGESWVLVVRDKFGSWIAIWTVALPGTGSGGFNGAVSILTDVGIEDCIITKTYKVMTFADGVLQTVT